MRSEILSREQRVVGGKQIVTAVIKPLERDSKPLSVVASLLRGLRLTFGYFARPSKVVTRQYPENRDTLTFPKRYRAMLHMIHDKEGCHNCTACKMCEKACPNGSIKVEGRKGPVSGRMELDYYTWRMDSCTFCNACVQACPFNAIEMGHEFENAVYDRRLLIFNLNKYAGPPTSVLESVEDPHRRGRMMEPRDVYGGPVPLAIPKECETAAAVLKIRNDQLLTGNDTQESRAILQEEEL